MNAWHRWLATTDHRTVGRAITGACNLGFLFLVVSGFYLWWPAALSWSRIRSVLLFRRGLPAKAREFNWHHVIGFWSAIPLAVIIGAGVVMSYPWANELVYRAFGERPPVAGAPRTPRAEPRTARGNEAIDIDGVLANASAVQPAWQIVTIRLPDRPAGPVAATVDAGNGGQPQLRGR